ncbi:MAG: hypothetical protein ACXVZH_01210 [Terriglobales bacterium]
MKRLISFARVVLVRERLCGSLWMIVLLLCLQAASPQASGQVLQSGDGELMCGEFSSIRLRPQDVRYSEPSPTHLNLMPARWASLRDSLVGYQKTGIPLVGLDGNRLVPTGGSDDAGLDYFVPRLASSLRLPLPVSLDIFLGGTLIGCFCLGLVGLLLLLKSPWIKYLAIFEILVLAILCLRVGDVYLIPAAVVLAVVPWVLYFSKKARPGRLIFLFLVLAGLYLGAANLVRTYSGTTVLLFCIPILGFYADAKPKGRIVMLASLTLGLLASSLYFRHVFSFRDAYLRSQQADYVEAPRQHPMWHSIYIGLGFVSNPYVAGGYCDQVAVDKVRSVSPNAVFLSPEYDRILAEQVRQLVRHHPTLLLVSLAAKAGILQMLTLLAGNFGLLAALCERKRWSLDLAFWIAIAFGALPGLLVVPIPKYLLGFIAMLVLYGLISLDYAIHQGAVQRLMRRFGRQEKILCAA